MKNFWNIMAILVFGIWTVSFFPVYILAKLILGIFGYKQIVEREYRILMEEIWMKEEGSY